MNEELELTDIFRLKPDNFMKASNINPLESENKPPFLEENLTKWFVDFSYELRNILFHFIIDPLDKDWQELFKYAYSGLKYLTRENINYLESKLEGNP